MKVFKNNLYPGISLILILLPIFSGCYTKLKKAEKIKQVQEKIVTIEPAQLEIDGVELKLNYLGPADLLKYAQNIRPLFPRDFDIILKDEYVNYAQEGYTEALILYNLFQRAPMDFYFDDFGNPVFMGWQVNPWTDHDLQPVVTVFSIKIYNKREHKIKIDPFGSVILDNNGNQIEALKPSEILSYDYRSTGKTFISIYFPGFIAFPPPGPYPYFTFGYQYFIEKDIILKTLLKEKTIFQGVRDEGLIAFPKLPPELNQFSFIFPEVILLRDNEIEKKIDFKFEIFIQSIKREL